MQILICLLLAVNVSSWQTADNCPPHCFCYQWGTMWRTDCMRINLYNTFLPFSHRTQVLDLSYNVISILHGNEFRDANLNRLKDLRLSNNRLQTIDKLSFNGLELLEYLDLSYNSIEYLNPNTFKYNPNLKVLNVSDNPLSVPANEPFLSSAPSLQVLSLAHTDLEYVDAGLFHNLEGLRALNLSNNNIQKIDPEALVLFRNLKYLDVSKNDLTCNDQSTILLQWLKNHRIQFPPFCQMLASMTLTEDINFDSNQRISNNRTVAETILPEERNIFQDVVHFFQSIPSLYAILCGMHIGILIGALPTYFYMRRTTRGPPVPLRTTSRNSERISLAERSSRFMGNDPDNLTFALIPLSTPPGTPPSPYHSRFTFPSSYSLPNI